MTSALTRGGSSRRWRRIRAYVLERDAYRCQVQGPHCIGKATTVDHITARALWPAGEAGVDDPDNLRAACGPCNTGVDVRTLVRGLGRPSRHW